MKKKTPYQVLQQQPELTYEQARLTLQIHVLMSKLAYLTRFYIIERITGIGDPQATINEMLRVSVEGNRLAAEVPGFTGNFLPVTTAYVEGLQGLVDGMISGNNEEADASIRRLYEIAEANAAYLAQQSPYWDADRWRAIFNDDINNLTQQVIAIESGDYVRALNIFETIMEKALIKGDYYAEGVIHFLPEDREKIPMTYFNMIKDLRKQGTRLAYLTRFYAVTEIIGFGGQDALDAVSERLYQLPRIVASQMELIFGPEVAEQLLTMLSIYVVQLEEIIDTILSGDEAAIEAKENEFRAYAKDLATFLSSINPYWEEEQLEELFNAFTELLFQEIIQLKSGDLEATTTFERFLYAVLAIADYWALGMYQYSISNGGTPQEQGPAGMPEA